MNNRYWCGTLKKSQERINTIADAFYEMFKHKKIAVFHANYIDKPFPRFDCEKDCQIERSDWLDGTKHPVKMTENGFMFSCGGYLYINLASDEKEDSCVCGFGKNPHFNFKHDRVIITSRAPAGHIHATMFVIVGDMDEDLQDHPDYMPSSSVQ